MVEHEYEPVPYKNLFNLRSTHDLDLYHNLIHSIQRIIKLYITNTKHETSRDLWFKSLSEDQQVAEIEAVKVNERGTF